METKQKRTKAVETLVNTAIRLNDLYRGDSLVPIPYHEALHQVNGNVFKLLSNEVDQFRHNPQDLTAAEKAFKSVKDMIIQVVPFQSLLDTKVQLSNFFAAIASEKHYSALEEEFQQHDALVYIKWRMKKYKKLLDFLQELFYIEQIDAEPYLEINLFTNLHREPGASQIITQKGFSQFDLYDEGILIEDGPEATGALSIDGVEGSNTLWQLRFHHVKSIIFRY